MFQILKQVFTLHTHAKRNNHNDDFPRVSFSNARNAGMALLAWIVFSGCSSVASPVPASIDISVPSDQRVSSLCSSQVMERENAIRGSQSPAQFLALANQAERCLEGITFYSSHPDNQMAMRLNALAVVNFVKSGDASSAQQSLKDFRMRFKKQDLVYADFTSFIDTATALLEPNLSERQLAMLNINPTLRNEMTRARNWSLN